MSEINGPIISAISSFLAVLVGTALVPSVRSYFSRRQAARYLAIRVVCTLDKYVYDCAMVASDMGQENYQGVTESQVSAPPTPSYPSDLDWHSIDYSKYFRYPLSLRKPLVSSMRRRSTLIRRIILSTSKPGAFSMRRLV
jgi:hypothetical protein